ncbi:uncharacterized protein SPAPADRAFT_50318 [Spathaspora passalidarum NRRL Y-27907]|uniref:F-box domain-containing protein n=1 Tax=Spathaspora passalidarum (strain NRRL Y-27907 / 11-Y1) TaxID=619300 RepID=G3AMJ5_SPAPN|nr:uncharacterized protein SPAPADRAFT_50318 [Spathaspora passalidarum NRRL Y-27907]EGW33439.1 hypothetical protein SPAPADRAFT_50318 [Spathaspora passalidarum NRRL Y-27907]
MEQYIHKNSKYQLVVVKTETECFAEGTFNNPIEIDDEPINDNDTIKTDILRLPEEVILEIFGHVNQIDATNIRLVNRQLYKLGTMKLFNSILVAFPEDTGLNIKGKCHVAAKLYSEYLINYTVINGFQKIARVLGMAELSMVKNILLYTAKVNNYSDHCYYYLVNKCPWITVNVISHSPVMFGKQFMRLDKISMLRVSNAYQFISDIPDNFSIKKLYLIGTQRVGSDSLALIPHLKALKFLYMEDNRELNIFNQLKQRNIANLKLKHLALRFPSFVIRQMEECFVMSEIVTFELQFFNQGTPYDDLNWLSTRMTKLRNIEITLWKMSFTMVMKQFQGHILHRIKLHSYATDKEVPSSQVATMLKGRESEITEVWATSGTNQYSGMLSSTLFFRTTKRSNSSTKQSISKQFSKTKYPNLNTILINEGLVLYCNIPP